MPDSTQCLPNYGKLYREPLRGVGLLGVIDLKLCGQSKTSLQPAGCPAHALKTPGFSK